MIIGKRARTIEKVEADRQKAISYKKTFGTPEGREVLFDLCNRYHVLGACESEIAEGERRVVVDILTRANIDLVQFDKILRGEI